jgi:DNA adenine methylase
MQMTRKMTPILKWAGGKTQLLDAIQARLPQGYNRYFEPFIGGGAVLLGIHPQQAVINDINEQLINLYSQIKGNSSAVIQQVAKLDGMSCDKEFYLSMRERYNQKIKAHELDAECAALMIWINKHCFNGLYRVNSKGLFNVPYNNKTHGKSIDEENVTSIGNYLRNTDVKIACGDFEEICHEVEPGDFVYFDSPYVPQSTTADFTDYTKDGFSLHDHQRLADLFRRLDSIGVKLMLSNNDVPLVHSLYEGYNIQSLSVKRLINRDAAKRKGTEVLITNY